MSTHAAPSAPASPPVAGANVPAVFALVPTHVKTALESLASAVDAVQLHSNAVRDIPLSQVIGTLADLAHAVNAVSGAATDVLDAAAAFVPPPPPPPPPVVPPPQPVAPTTAFHSTGPWIAGRLYIIVPEQPLTAIPDNGEKWFAITRGTYVGLTKNSAISIHAVTGVASGLSDKCSSQASALDHFNSALATGAVAVLP